MKLISEINQFFGILKGKGDFASFFFACGLCDTFRLGYLFLEDVPVFLLLFATRGMFYILIELHG